MTRQLYAQSGAATSNWRQAVQEVKQEVLQCGGASLPALCNCLDQFPGGSWSDLTTLAQDLAVIGQQLHALSCQHTSTGDVLQTTQQQQQQQQQQPTLPHQQQQQQAPVLADVVHACIRFCKAVTDVLAAVPKPHEQQPQHSRWQHSQRHRQQQQQQQHAQQHLLPAAAATALCSCLRQWADPMLLPAVCQHSPGLQETDLPQAAVVALGALLPSQLPVISAHERAAVLALLLALAQPPTHSSSTSTSAAGSSSSGSNTMTAAAGPSTGQHGQEQQQHMQDTQHWALACKAVVALTDTMSEALRSSSAATATAGSSKQSVGSAAGTVGLRPEEAASVTAGLVEALSTSCGIRSGSSGSSSRGGSAGGASAAAAAGSQSASGNRSGSTGGSSGGAQVSSSRQQPVEGTVQSQYYASLLVALNHAVNSNKQGWQSHAGAITESARKLFTYGTQQQLQQQQQQQGKEIQGSAAISTASAAAAAVSSNGSPAAAVAQSTAAGRQPPKKKYVPPYARAAAAVQSPSKHPQQQQQQQWQESSDESEQSASDWSDVSDSEYFQGNSSRRFSSSSSSKDRSQQKQQQQQQQQLHDPIKAVRVRSALLQLLQVLIQADPSALHPYWAALLPSQAPLQQTPLSPHLLTMLLYDPSDKVRLLAAAVLGAMLEGPAARSLLAVAEAKTSHPPLRGFITMSVSLGHMLISLHSGLLAVITAWQQQQQGVLQVPVVLLTAVLRVLCALVPVAPYERLPGTLLTEVVDRVWQLWQAMQPQPPEAAAAAAMQSSITLSGANGGAGVAVPRLALSAATAAAAAGPAGAGAPTWSSNSSSSTMVAVVAVLAQALSTKKPLPALGRWLNSSSSSSSSRSSTTSSSRGAALISGLLAAAGAPDCLLRIEALAALRGCCINYPAAVPPLAQVLQPAAGKERTPNSSSNSPDSSSSGEQAHGWQQLLGVVGVAAAAQPASARSTPRSSPRVSDTADTPAAAAAAAGGGGGGGGDGSGSTNPEVKAGQHAVRLLGDWLAAAGSTGGEAMADGGQHQQQQQQQQQAAIKQLGSQWESVLQLLLSDSVWHHPSPVIRSAAAAVAGMIPAEVWLVLPHALWQQLLGAAAGTAAGADVTAVRAAACKLLGSCAVMPGVLGQQQQQQQTGDAQQQQQQQQQCPEQQILQALAQCVSDEAVSVRLSAAWALANVCDELRQQLDTMPVDAACAAGSGSSSASGDVQQQQQQQEEEEEGICVAPCGPVMGPPVLRLLCDAAVAAAGDTEKVRAHGVRAVGALLAAWQPCWGVATNTTTSSSNRGHSPLPAVTVAAAAAAAEVWSWVPSWFKAAFGALQSCLAARSMKVVWNAACAAAAGLQNQHILIVPAVADSTPGLLRMLVVLVRDSSNYKIKTHAAAALASPADRAAYGEVFRDVLLVVLAALQGLNSSSSSAVPVVGDGGSSASSSSAAAADGQQSSASSADGLDDEGAFPNYRYIPGLQAQLEASLCHLLSLLQPSDSTRLKEQLRRNQQLLLTALARCAKAEGAANAGQQQGAGFVAKAGATGVVERLGRGEECGRGDQQQNVANCVHGSRASLPASRAYESSDSSQQEEGVAGQAAMQQQQQQVKSALPVDPFGQGARQSADGSAVVTSNRGIAATGAAGSSASKAAAGCGGQSTVGALSWRSATNDVGSPAVSSQGVADSCGARVGAEQGVADGGLSVSEGVQAALKGLSAVLGPTVVDAWTRQMQV